MSTIYVLWLRQIKKYFRSKSRIVGSLGQPLLFLVVFGFGFSSVYQKAGEGSYIQFLAPGIILMSVLFTAIFSGIELIWDRQFGFLKETMVAPVSRMEIMLGRTLGGATIATIQGVIVFILTLFAGFKPADMTLLPAALLLTFLAALLFTVLGTSIASLLEDMQAFPLIMNFLVMPLFFLSGALFPVESAPKVMQIIAKINPLSYGVDGVRELLILRSNFGMFADFTVIIIVTAALLALGSYLFQRIQI